MSAVYASVFFPKQLEANQDVWPEKLHVIKYGTLLFLNITISLWGIVNRENVLSIKHIQHTLGMQEYQENTFIFGSRHSEPYWVMIKQSSHFNTRIGVLIYYWETILGILKPQLSVVQMFMVALNLFCKAKPLLTSHSGIGQQKTSLPKYCHVVVALSWSQWLNCQWLGHCLTVMVTVTYNLLRKKALSILDTKLTLFKAPTTCQRWT